MDMPNEQQSRAASIAMAGYWKLEPGRALSLYPVHASTLRIGQGLAWVTLGIAPRGHGTLSGDHMLGPGQALPVAAGRHLVLESANADPLYFDWMLAPLAQEASSSRWEQTVGQPLRDFGLAVAMAGAALLRLLRGLWSYGRLRVAGNGSAMSGCPGHRP